MKRLVGPAIRPLGVVGAASILMATMFFGGSASAGTNGQQVSVCNARTDVTNILIGGDNQNGDFTQLWLGKNNGWCATTWGYWFKGDIQADFYTSDMTYLGHWDCGNAPESQVGDIYGCYRSQ